VVVCLSEFDEFLRFIFDIYGSGGDGQITLQDYTDVLRTILPANTDER
jgi:Ca2+-binding EF-hand superfamily protein